MLEQNRHLCNKGELTMRPRLRLGSTDIGIACNVADERIRPAGAAQRNDREDGQSCAKSHRG